MPAPQVSANVTLASPPANLTANADTPLSFAVPARPRVYNGTTATIYVQLDAAASLGAIPVGPGQLFSEDAACNVIHIYATAAFALGGSSGNNVSVWGWGF